MMIMVIVFFAARLLHEILSSRWKLTQVISRLVIYMRQVMAVY